MWDGSGQKGERSSIKKFTLYTQQSTHFLPGEAVFCSLPFITHSRLSFLTSDNPPLEEESMRLRNHAFLYMALLLGSIVGSANAAPISDATLHDFLSWSIGDTGAPDCPEQYHSPACLLPGGGNRSCLMKEAIKSAKAEDCENAFRQTLVPQCHNSDARTKITEKGQVGPAGASVQKPTVWVHKTSGVMKN